MYEINERIRKLRKELDLTQTEFGSRLHVGRGVINNIDRDLVEPKALFIDNVVSTFQVNRTWLETGEGEMFPETSREEKLGRLVSDVLDDEPDSFRRHIVEVLAELDADGWRNLREAAETLQTLFGNGKKDRD